MSEYDDIVKEKLKFKSDSNKKKKINNSKKRNIGQILSNIPLEKKEKHTALLTKAELTFQKMQEKVQKTQILQRASLSHKQRVEAFNRHLESLTEHFDISKVSWTK